MILRGHIEHQEKLIEHLKCQAYPMKFTYPVNSPLGGKINVDETRFAEGQVRPIQLIEYVIPEEYVQPVCNNLGIPTEETWFNHAPGKGGTSFISGFGVKGILEAMRLALGAEKLPKLDPTKPSWTHPIYKDHVNILGIGWRKDEEGIIKGDMQQEKI